MTLLQRFLDDRTGATAVEYGLLISLIALGLVVGLGNFSDALLGVFETINNALTGVKA